MPRLLPNWLTRFQPTFDPHPYSIQALQRHSFDYELTFLSGRYNITTKTCFLKIAREELYFPNSGR